MIGGWCNTCGRLVLRLLKDWLTYNSPINHLLEAAIRVFSKDSCRQLKVRTSRSSPITYSSSEHKEKVVYDYFTLESVQEQR